MEGGGGGENKFSPPRARSNSPLPEGPQTLSTLPKIFLLFGISHTVHTFNPAS